MLLQIIKEAIAMSTAEPSTSKETTETATEPSTSKERSEIASGPSTSKQEEITPSPVYKHTPLHEETTSLIPDMPQVSSPRPANLSDAVTACVDCAQLLKENRQLTNRVKTLREILGKRRKEVKTYRRKRKNINKNSYTFVFQTFIRVIAQQWTLLLTHIGPFH
jgi:hypothetical protein